MKKNLFLALIILAISSCQKENNNESYLSGKLSFSITVKSNALLKSATLGNASSVLISIESFSGKSVYESQKVQLYNFNGTYLSEPLALNVGQYYLTKFMVLDSTSKVIYATPIKGSSMAHLIQNPLPLIFNISEDSTTKIVPEVISTSESSPIDFGYLDVSFQLVKTFDILISVFSYDSVSKNFQLTDASITISDSNKVLYTLPLETKTNKITVNDELGIYKLKVAKNGYTSYIRTFSADSLKIFSNEPLIVVLSPLDIYITNGLVAYYPFNGNASDESSNGNNGIVYGATLTTDRFGNIKCAYSFNGMDNYILLPEKKIVNLDCYSYSVWINPNGVPTNYSGMVYSIGDSYGYECQSFVFQPTSTMFAGSYNIGSNPLQSYSKSEEIQSNQWLHVVVTRDSLNIKMYINNKLVPIQPNSNINKQIASYGQISKSAIIGGRSNLNYDSYYNGIIDDIRIYNRVLNDNEISELFKLNK